MMPFNKKRLIVDISFGLAACGGGASSNNGSDSSTGVPNLTILADGISLRSMSATSTGLTEISNASIPSAALAVDHQIFGLAIHPNKRWVYAASESLNWGNARISRFEIDWTSGKLTYVDSFLLTSGSGLVCADSDNCAPVGLGITPEGSRLIVQDGSTFLTFAIAADGSLSYVNSAAAAGRFHGVGINSTGTYVYQGSEAYSRIGDTITDLNNLGQLGNASVVVKNNGVDRLYTTVLVDNVGVFDLTDPAAPAPIARINPDVAGGSGTAVYMAVNQDGSRMLAIGDRSIAVIDFDGTILTRRSQLAVTGWARGVTFNADGTMAIVSFQTGGAVLYSIAADGTMTEVGFYGSTNATRAVLFSTHP
jgi:hypothetical protein